MASFHVSRVLLNSSMTAVSCLTDVRMKPIRSVSVGTLYMTVIVSCFPGVLDFVRYQAPCVSRVA